MIHTLLKVLANNLRCGRCFSILLGGSQGDQLSPPRDQLVEFVLFFMGFGDGTWPNLMSESCDHTSVNAVGLGEDAKSLGEVANLTWVNDGHHMTGIHEFQNCVLFVPAANTGQGAL